MTKPWELEEAEIIDALCRRYHQLPSAVLAEDVSILRRLALLSGGQSQQSEWPELD